MNRHVALTAATSRVRLALANGDPVELQKLSLGGPTIVKGIIEHPMKLHRRSVADRAVWAHLIVVSTPRAVVAVGSKLGLDPPLGRLVAQLQALLAVEPAYPLDSSARPAERGRPAEC
jgi:hypothetical protein